LVAASIEPPGPAQAPPRDAEWGERFFHVTDPTTRDQFCLAAEALIFL
jgi:hypothetical protein